MRVPHVAFLGAGSFAAAHAFALSALAHHYPDAPRPVRVAVASGTGPKARSFADRHGFAHVLSSEELWDRDDIDTLFVVSPNRLHHDHLTRALASESIERIYVEKPVCVTEAEEASLAGAVRSPGRVRVVQAGFQFLQMTSIRRALILWRRGELGRPVHFVARYLHGGYLDPEYRAVRGPRLAPTPEGGALVDLGSHALSLLVAFLGDGLEVVAARSSGRFPDVPLRSDLCTTVMLEDSRSGAGGTVTASRVSAGSGDLLELELWCENGCLRVSTGRPDVVEILRGPHCGESSRIHCGSDYGPVSRFPAATAPPGWLRSLVHAHYLFFGGSDPDALVPDLGHALAVQRLLGRSATQLDQRWNRTPQNM
ncbi:MAG: Gfo/Idh/MocA family oxidoreductase [Candidatus Riflebacteria bacterium]|nr:Gfo/Idh/MocA family oxidoreductase [Candidatus Riflebacteria bacterium]